MFKTKKTWKLRWQAIIEYIRYVHQRAESVGHVRIHSAVIQEDN